VDLSLKRIFQLYGAILATLLLFRLFVQNGSAESGDGAGSAFELFLHDIFVRLATIYLDTFNRPSTALTLSLSIVMLGLFLSVWFWFARIRPTCRMVDALIAVTGRSEHEGLEPIDTAMASIPALTADWNAYRATLSAGNGAVFIRPGQFITLRTFDRGGLHLGFFQAVPGYFVGLGLVLTFLGLVAGLYFASRGMRTGNLEQARDALIHLLNAATFKFMTSIAGVSMSLLFSIVFRLGLQRLRGRIDNLCHRIEELSLAGLLVGYTAEPAPVLRFGALSLPRNESAVDPGVGRTGTGPG
jgi:hypothetical protein